MPARELAELLGWRIRFAGRGICRKAARLQVRKSGVRSLMVRKPDIFGHSDFRTFGLSDIRTFGHSDFRTNGAMGMKGGSPEYGAGHGSGGHRLPTRWQVTVMERRECPVRRTPSGSFRAHATSANQLARVARASRGNGQPVIAGGRCLAAGIMPPLSFLASPDCRSVAFVKSASVGKLEIARLSDLRTAMAKNPITL